MESRAFPLIRYNPDKGILPEECFDLDGNPSVDTDWPSYTLKYTDDNGKPAEMELPLTFADFAITEGRFRKQFRTVPRDAWNDNMIPLAEYLELSAEDREGQVPVHLGSRQEEPPDPRDSRRSRWCCRAKTGAISGGC